MKKNLMKIILIGVGSVLLLNNAHALHMSQNARLGSIQMDPQFPSPVVSGNVEVNFLDKEIILNLDKSESCPKCRYYIPNVITFSVPIFKIYEDSCGVKIYEGESLEDNLGPHSKIIVKDYQKMTCEIYIRDLTAVEFHLSIFNEANSKNTLLTSHLSGEVLK